MRLARVEKGGYYPYPPHIAEATASWFISLPVGTQGRFLDPCAGEGEIASLLGRLLNCETWGCELFPYRAGQVGVNHILILQGGFQGFRIQNVIFDDGYSIGIRIFYPICPTQIQGKMNIRVLQKKWDRIACKLTIRTKNQNIKHGYIVRLECR